MCLSQPPERLTPTDEITQAYKVFFTKDDDRKQDGLFGVYIECDRNYPVNEWLTATTGNSGGYAENGVIRVARSRFFSDDGFSYPVGFHCYVTETDAREHSWFTAFDSYRPQIRKVLLRQLHSRGVEGETVVVVANQMLITDEVIATAGY